MVKTMLIGLPCTINLQIRSVDGLGLGQLVMPFTHYRNLIAVERRFKKGDGVVREELRRDGTCDAVPVPLFSLAESYVLNGLDRSEYIRTALRLNGHDVLRSPAIEPDIDLVDFDLPVVGNFRAEVVLQRIR